MLPSGIRARLLWLVAAAIIPFLVLSGIGLGTEWRREHDAAIRRALDEARLIAAQVDDHIAVGAWRSEMNGSRTGRSRQVRDRHAEVQQRTVTTEHKRGDASTSARRGRHRGLVRHHGRECNRMHARLVVLSRNNGWRQAEHEDHRQRESEPSHAQTVDLPEDSPPAHPRITPPAGRP